LSEAKDTSELMVDLGYAALLLCGFHLVDDEETGECELVPVGGRAGG